MKLRRRNCFGLLIRRRKLNFKFTSQYSVGPYILDFYCVERRLVIELDGFQHIENKEYDTERDNYLLCNDIKVVRFWNREINANIDKVLDKIWERISVVDKKIQDKEPYKLFKTDFEFEKNIVTDLLTDLYVISKSLEPVMPHTAEIILHLS